MATFQFSATTSREPDDVLRFFSDMRNAPSWDSSVREVVRLDGDGDGAVTLGSSFRVTVAAASRTVTLTYRVIVLDTHDGLVLRATNRLFTSEDTVTVRPLHGEQSEVTYHARLSGHGVMRLAEPLLQRTIDGLGARAGAKLREIYFS